MGMNFFRILYMQQNNTPQENNLSPASVPEKKFLITGDRIGIYEILEELGRGGTGYVFKAYNLETKKFVALKVLHQQYSMNQLQKKRFYHEAETLKLLSHPHIAGFIESGTHEQLHYFVLELLEGGSLEKMIREKTLTLKKSLQIVLDITEALEYAHTHGVIHRDIKPSNILFDAQGVLKITDFGLAKLDEVTCLTVSGTILGTPAYMSPEQIYGENNAYMGPHTDIYSLGVMLYQMLTNKLPFDGISNIATLKKVTDTEPAYPRSINPDLPKEVEAIILKAMEKNIQKRYQRCQDMIDDIKRYQAGLPVFARSVTFFSKALKGVKRHRYTAISISVIFCALLFTFIVWLQQQHIEETRKKILQKIQGELKIAQHERHNLINKLNEEPLFRALKDEDPFVRDKAIIALHKKFREKKIQGEMAEKTFVLTLETLKDTDPQVRSSSAILLGLLKDSRAVPQLITLLHDPSTDVINSAILALSWITDSRAVEPVIPLITHENAQTRETAIMAFGLLKDKKALTPILQALTDPAASVRKSAALILGVLKYDEAIPALINATKDSDSAVRERAQASLLLFGDTAAVQLAINTLSEKNLDDASLLKALEMIIKKPEKTAVPLLIHHLEKTAAIIVKRKIILVLGLLQESVAVQPLISLLNQRNPELEGDIILALKYITHAYPGNTPEAWEQWYMTKNNEP